MQPSTRRYWRIVARLPHNYLSFHLDRACASLVPKQAVKSQTQLLSTLKVAEAAMRSSALGKSLAVKGAPTEPMWTTHFGAEPSQVTTCQS